ncbi:MAG: hypothetical protein GXP32_04165 [Kiritimatiellaeota bacterium]|nr:hypothetical protein [Kiritimatiellota bacterium]
MKKMFHSLIRLSAATVVCAGCACLLASGCASTENSTETSLEQTDKRPIAKKTNFGDYDRQLINAERKKRRLMYQLDHAKSTDEIIRCEEDLDRIHTEIALLKENKDSMAASKEDNFKSVKERNYTYGPLGIVFKITQWVLETLFLIDRS